MAGAKEFESIQRRKRFHTFLLFDNLKFVCRFLIYFIWYVRQEYAKGKREGKKKLWKSNMFHVIPPSVKLCTNIIQKNYNPTDSKH